MCFAPQRRALIRHLNFQKWSDTEVLCTFSLRNVLRATTACTFSTSQLPKVLRDPGVLYILTCKCASFHNGVQFFISHLASWLRTRRFSEPTFRPSRAPNHWKNTVFRDFPTFSTTSEPPRVVRTPSPLYILTWKCASCHNDVHFLDILTSKSGPRMVCFVHFHFEMCFAPQRRALFRHRNFQKCSETQVFCTFWLVHVLRATTAYNFSSLIWPAGSAPAALASLLFDPPEPQIIIGKTKCFLSSNLSLLSASALLCFSSVHIVGSLNSKLPSTMDYCGLLWVTTGCYGLLWVIVGYCGLLWDTMGSYGLLLVTVGYSGLLWATVGYCGLLSVTKRYYGVLWVTMGYCRLLWLLWVTMGYRGYYGVLWFTVG